MCGADRNNSRNEQTCIFKDTQGQRCSETNERPKKSYYPNDRILSRPAPEEETKSEDRCRARQSESRSIRISMS